MGSIDGVLAHQNVPIPGAKTALRYLHDNHIPFILLTNGGGKHEQERVDQFSEIFGVKLTLDNFVQAHTPFQRLVDGPENFRNKTILVTGTNPTQCREIAQM